MTRSTRPTRWTASPSPTIASAVISDSVASYQHAVRIYRDLGDRYNEAETLVSLGDTHLTAGDPGGAGRDWQHAMMIFEELCHPAAGQVRAKLSNLASTAGV